jgi:hypothetical protein
MFLKLKEFGGISFRPEESGWNYLSILIPLASCQQTCMTHTIALCTTKKLPMMDRGTVQNM